MVQTESDADEYLSVMREKTIEFAIIFTDLHIIYAKIFIIGQY